MFWNTKIAIGIAMVAIAHADNNDDHENPRLEILGCQALTCAPPEGSVCSTGELPGPPVGIGMASQAVNSTTFSGSLSITLIDGLRENGFTGVGSSEYEYSDQQLFVGVAPDSSDYPHGCALMMQYMGQTLPLEPFLDDDTRPGSTEGTTSCQGVLNPLCRASIVDIIRDFDDVPDNGDVQCSGLVDHVNTELRGSPGACGGDGGWIANFFNVTGGPLPRANSSVARADRLGDDGCKPIQPASFEMYKAAEMRQLFFHDPPEAAAGFLGRLYGGRTGWTPVMTVIFGASDDASQAPEVSFLCMETFDRDGGKRESPLDASAPSSGPPSLLLPASVLVATLVGLF